MDQSLGSSFDVSETGVLVPEPVAAVAVVGWLRSASRACWTAPSSLLIPLRPTRTPAATATGRRTKNPTTAARLVTLRVPALRVASARRCRLAAAKYREVGFAASPRRAPHWMQ